MVIGRKFWKENVDLIVDAKKSFSKNHINCYLDFNKNTSKVACSYVYKSYQLTNLFDVEKISEIPGDGLGFIYSKNVAYKILNLYINANYNYLYMDNSYFSSFYDEKISRFRITVNNIHPQKNVEIEANRKFELASWKKRNEPELHILICPPTGEVLKIFNIGDTWLRDTIKKIRRETNRKILIRFKNYDYVTSEKLTYLEKIKHDFGNVYFDRNITDSDLFQLFGKCYAVVAPASGVGVIAATQGIPVFSESFGPVSSISQHDYSTINSPIYPNREQWINNILSHEFTLHEIFTGEWIGRLKKIYPRDLKRVLNEKINIL